MSDEQPRFVPRAWSTVILSQIQHETPGWRMVREMARQDDERLRCEHPWRWRWAHARARVWRLWQDAARIVPVRWIGFGHEWHEWEDDE